MQVKQGGRAYIISGELRATLQYIVYSVLEMASADAHDMELDETTREQAHRAAQQLLDIHALLANAEGGEVTQWN